MIKKNVLRDIIFGVILIYFISSFTEMFNEYPEYLNITAFLWGVPLVYFYFIYITYKKTKYAMKSFVIHGLIGQILTVIISILTLYMLIKEYDLKSIIAINIIYLILCLLIYFYYKIYKFF